jgi:hypothetical protein
MKLCLQIAGALQLLLALSHFFFAHRLDWREDLQHVSLFTRQVFWVHMSFLVYVLAAFGGMDLFLAEELLQPQPLPRAILFTLTLFWAARLYCQFFVYRRELWQGDRFRTVVHFAFVLLWAYLTAVHAIAFIRQW